jgi:hypothetical protein
MRSTQTNCCMDNDHVYCLQQIIVIVLTAML